MKNEERHAIPRDLGEVYPLTLYTAIAEPITPIIGAIQKTIRTELLMLASELVAANRLLMKSVIQN